MTAGERKENIESEKKQERERIGKRGETTDVRQTKEQVRDTHREKETSEKE